jgi:hypothetical protein
MDPEGTVVSKEFLVVAPLVAMGGTTAVGALIISVALFGRRKYSRRAFRLLKIVTRR